LRRPLSGINGVLRNAHLIGVSGRNDCRTHRRLLDEYDRAFNSWVDYTAEEEQYTRQANPAQTQELAVARVEEKHQELLKHEQCCPNCKEG
jgi:hypothetical protein